jgi:hypothetical protein
MGLNITSSNINKIETAIVLNSNNPQYEPSNPIPPNGAENWILILLCWTGGDPDGDSVTYDIFFGNTTPLNIIEYNWS